MCLDINPDSVIHKHLVNKLYNIDHLTIHASAINTLAELEMLPSFHISLGAPPENVKPQTIQLFVDDEINLGLQQIIGSIALSNIFVSAKNNKKSAWIDVTNLTFRLIDREVETQIVSEDSNLHVLNKYYHAVCRRDVNREWHISLANLTGNPHDSIARPENCIIDTITA